ncbi:discoidin domain-containing protein [Methylibium sp. Pch-M]|uniref:discoidin domain-containing protein n=1 Tax=Methylibium sp. Pch-M TaxID=2082386 RepID=UPI0013ED47D6|nr:discoidin domain-containing protein [Methylibium sp. Pch-M]
MRNRQILTGEAIRRIGPGLAVSACLLISACGGGETDNASEATAASSAKARIAAIAAPAQAVWSAPVPLTLVPSAAANLPNGKVLMWSADSRFDFTSTAGNTYSTLFDPATNMATERLINETNHNMFCPGTTNLPDGRLLVSGGSSAGTTSIYNPATGAWAAAAAMNIPRAYQANTILQDGSILTLGGSWNGGQGNKHAEIWTEAGGWRRLTGVAVNPMVGPDPGGIFRGDNHMWLIPTGTGQVLHAGPSANMNWINTQGNGSSVPAGTRGDDAYAINGSTVMYDIGKILKTGGAPAYENVDATASSYVIDVNAGLSVRKIAPMSYARAFHNSVVLPNGQVLIVGGQTRPVPFSDDRSVLIPELWDPVTEAFTAMPAMTVPRNYHGVALLLHDGRVLSAGGGLCGQGCAGNHPDVQILTPNYLMNSDGSAATRPVINTFPVQVEYGKKMAVTTSSAVTSFVLIRLSSTTHTVNNDQRRIPLAFASTGTNSYSIDVPTNPGIALPGQYMLFAIDGQGVPSVAKTVRIGAGTAPQLQSPGTQAGTAGVPVSLSTTATAPNGLGITFRATGLPPGLSMNATTGSITGTPSAGGDFKVSIFAATTSGETSTDFMWNVVGATSGPISVRYVRLEEVTEINGGAWASMAEFNLLDTNGATISRTGWTVSADSQETQGENAPAANAIDGNTATFWHTQWSGANPPPPHTFTVNLGAVRNVGGFKYLPRQSGANGTIAQFRFYVSADGINWGVPVATGDFSTMGARAVEKTVLFTVPGANQAPTVNSPGAQSHTQGQTVTLGISASDPDGDTLTYSASGLPAGLNISASTGVISGTVNTAGNYSPTVTAQDGNGASDTTAFAWTVIPVQPVINPVLAPPVVAGGTATFNVTSNMGAGVQYRWDFGDGTPETAYSTAATVTHLYAAPGLYTVTVTALSTSGAVKTLSFTQAIYGAISGSTRPSGSTNVVVETRAGQNPRVWLVNQDNDSVSVFDGVTYNKVAEVAVGVDPRTLAVAPDGRVWVTNKSGSSISVISPSSLSVVQTIALPRASMPYGLAFAPNGSAAYVALEASGQLLKLNVSSGAVLGSAAVGANARHLSIPVASDRVFVSRFISPPLPGEGSTVVQTEVAGVKRGGEVVVVTSAMAIERTIVLQHSDLPDTTLQGRGIPNYLASPVIAPDGKSAWVPSKQDNVKRGTRRDGLALNFESTVRAITSRIDLVTFAEDYAARVDHDNSSLASAAAFHPTGAYLFVALQTSRHVAVIDPVREVELFRFDAGRAPDGVAVSPDGLTLYVNNFMDRTLGVFDLTRLVRYGEFSVPASAAVDAVAVEKLSAVVLTGKQFFYDARDTRLSRDAYMSCAACHNDGGHDGRTWDLSSLGEGLRNTISLRGRAGGQGFKHWSGNFDEIQDFEGQIRTLAQGAGLMTDVQFNTGTRSQPLGTTKAGVSADLDALAAYVGSLNTFAPTPNRNADGSLTAAGTAGQAVFASKCSTCHSGTAFTESGASTLRDIGTLKASSGNRLGGTLTGIDTPTLRDVWATAPYLHDGSAASVTAAIQAHTAIVLTATELSNVASYVAQIGAEEATAPTSTPGGGGGGTQYVRLEALSEVMGRAYTTMAEFNLLDATGAVIPRTGWTVVADSQETQGENGAATNAIDGSTTTFWHTQWQAASPPPPHTFTVNLGTARSVGGFKYLPRQNLSVGRIAGWRFLTSPDGTNWTVVAQGTFTNDATERTVTFQAPTNQVPVLTAVANLSTTVGQSATLALSATDPDGDALTYSATGLPAGVAINAGTGLIAGSPTVAGTYNVVAQVSDGRGGVANRAFVWTVTAASGGGGTQYVRLEALSEVMGRAYTTMAEFNLLDATGAVIPRTGWTVVADSQETQGENGAATNAIDGSTTTFWHTQWQAASPPPPHTFTVNLGTARSVGGFKYLPRQNLSVGRIAGWRFLTSPDGTNWTVVAQGTFTNDATERTVTFTPP